MFIRQPSWVWSMWMYGKELALDSTPNRSGSAGAGPEHPPLDRYRPGGGSGHPHRRNGDQLPSSTAGHRSHWPSRVTMKESPSRRRQRTGVSIARTVSRTAEDGRGLMIIDVLSDEWALFPSTKASRSGSDCMSAMC